MADPTEAVRRDLVAAINADPGDRAALEAAHGRVWDSDEIRAEYEVIGFAAPFMVVRRKADNQRGSLVFQHHPRFYWGFQADCGGR